MVRVGCVLAACLLSGSLAMSQTPDQAETGGTRQELLDWAQQILEEGMKRVNREKAAEIRELVEDSLEVGASPEEMEAFLDEHGIHYIFDGKFDHRYNAIIRDIENDSIWRQSVVIYLYVDENKNFVRAEVRDSFR